MINANKCKCAFKQFLKCKKKKTLFLFCLKLYCFVKFNKEAQSLLGVSRNKLIALLFRVEASLYFFSYYSQL